MGLPCISTSIHPADSLPLIFRLVLSLQSDRMIQVLDHLNTLKLLCLVLGMDFKHMVVEIHPNLDDNEGSMSISEDTIKRLRVATQKLREIKIERMQKVNYGGKFICHWML